MGTFLPDFLPGALLDRRDVNLPAGTGKSFWLCGSTWEFPTYKNADTFVDRLVRAELLVRDPLVETVLHEGPLDLSPAPCSIVSSRRPG